MHILASASLVLFFSLAANSGSAGCAVNLTKLTAPQSVKAKVPYNVVLAMEKSGNPELTKGQFWWNDEGPFDTKLMQIMGSIRAKLYTGNPNTYTLKASLIYKCDGKTYETNKVETKLVVKKK